MVTIRPEQAGDYAAIAAINLRAFGLRTGEAAIVALHRHRPGFDPELSLVAEVDGQVAGHALFSPHRVQVLGQPVPAVNLAPIAVDPAFQGRGLGGQLIEAGHASAREKGYAFVFLLGHATYYPRFGYRTHAYGAASLRLPAAGLPAPTLEARPVQAEDGPALRALWETCEGPVDFALDPGSELVEWLSPNPLIAATVYTAEGRVVAYTRVHAARPAEPAYCLAADAETTRQVAAHVARAAGAEAVSLPLHPASPAAAGLGATVKAWEAGMACPLRPSPLDEYFEALAAGRRPPGRVAWPVAFDLA